MVFTDKLKRSVTLAVAALLFAASLIPLLNRQTADAYALVTLREIKLSNSTAAATAVTYRVTYTAATAHTVRGIVVDFCGGTGGNTPIIGDVCVIPTGFTVGTPTVTLNSGISGGTWASGAASANSGRTLVLSDTTGNAMTAGSTVVSFDLTTATNPTATNTTFYARILTYTNASGGNSPDTYTGTANGTNTTGSIDAGGVALSTANQITVTSKVQERLTFCVFTVDGTPADTCGSTTPVSGNSISLGDNNGVLSDTEAFVNKEPKFTISTNASSNAIVRAKATATLTSGSFTINAIAAGNGSGTTSVTGSEQFGFCAYQSTGSGLTLSAPYNDTVDCAATTDTSGNAPGAGGGDNGATFGFDTTTGGENLTTTFGDVVATKPPGAYSTAVLPFIGNIATTTEPGIYTSTMTFIATGTY